MILVVAISVLCCVPLAVDISFGVILPPDMVAIVIGIASTLAALSLML